jgi:hypothetical protein
MPAMYGLLTDQESKEKVRRVLDSYIDLRPDVKGETLCQELKNVLLGTVPPEKKQI